MSKPDKATLKDLSDAAYVEYLRELVAIGIEDLEAGRWVTQEEVEARYPWPRDGEPEEFEDEP